MEISKLMGLGLVIIMTPTLVASPASAQPEKGPRCSDGIDNDGDGFIDGEDPDCAGNDGGGTSGRDFRITIDWDGAMTDHTFQDVTIDCRQNYCDMEAIDLYEFRIPETYWSQWTLADARECFGASLDPSEDAVVDGLMLRVRDHHGAPDHWGVGVDYRASFIGSTQIKTHHANLQGDCVSECADLPPASSTVNTYPDGYLTRTQVSSRGPKPDGTPCTCAWDDCTFVPNGVTVTVEEVP